MLIARDFLGDDDFVMYLGDNMLEQGLGQFVERFAAEREGSLWANAPAVAQILLKEVPNPTAFGVAEVDDHGRVVRLVEKPKDPPSNLALVGVYLFTRRIHDAVAAIAPSPRGELEITDAIQWLIDQGERCATKCCKGWWIDTGKKDPLLECNRMVLDTLEAKVSGDVDADSIVEGRVVIEVGAALINSRVRGPAIIGSGSRIVNSYIGPYSSIASGLRDHRQRSRALGRSRTQPHRRCRPLDRLVDRARCRGAALARPPRGDPHDAGRRQSRRAGVTMATITASAQIAGVFIVEPVVHGDERGSSSRPTGASGSPGAR